jgi:hypothetical protein
MHGLCLSAWHLMHAFHHCSFGTFLNSDLDRAFFLQICKGRCDSRALLIAASYYDPVMQCAGLSSTDYRHVSRCRLARGVTSLDAQTSINRDYALSSLRTGL